MRQFLKTLTSLDLKLRYKKKRNYLINWIDAASCQTWTPINQLPGLMKIVTVGICVEVKKDYATFALSMDENDYVTETISIPHENITFVKELR